MELEDSGAAMVPSTPPSRVGSNSVVMSWSMVLGSGKAALGEVVLSCCHWYSWQVSSFFLPAIMLGKGFNHHVGDVWGIFGPDLDILHGSSPVSVEHAFISRVLVFIRSQVWHVVYVSTVYLKVMGKSHGPQPNTGSLSSSSGVLALG